MTSSLHSFAGLKSPLIYAMLMSAMLACSSGDDSAGTGGSPPGTGGNASTGGSNATGGATGATGGSTGTGGVAEAAAPIDTILFDFNADLQGLHYNTFGITDAGVLDTTDAGLALNLSNVAQLSIDSADGNPTPGSVRVQIPFTAYSQYADFVIAPTTTLDLTHKILFVKYRLDSGFAPNASAPGGVIFYVQTGASFVYGQLPYSNVTPVTGTTPGPWVELHFDVDHPDISYITPPPVPPVPPGYDPTSVVLIGIKFHVGGGVGQTVPPTEAVFHVDTIGYR